MTAGNPREVTRRQHVVPKMLLEGFANTAGHVHVWPRGQKRYTTSLTNAMVVTDFYSHTEDDGERSAMVEDWLGEDVEGPAAPVLRDLRAGSTPSADDAEVLAKFAAATLMRSEAMRTTAAELGHELNPLRIAERHASAGRVTPGERRILRTLRASGHEKYEWDPETRRLLALRIMLRLYDKYSTVLLGRRWTLARSDKLMLVAGDTMATPDQRRRPGWHGALPEGVPLLLPISATCLLIAHERPRSSPEVKLTKGRARSANAALCRAAESRAVTHPEMPWPSGLAFPAERSPLPVPRVQITPSNRPDTFPAQYPPVRDPAVRALLDRLGAIDVVE